MHRPSSRQPASQTSSIRRSAAKSSLSGSSHSAHPIRSKSSAVIGDGDDESEGEGRHGLIANDTHGPSSTFASTIASSSSHMGNRRPWKHTHFPPASTSLSSTSGSPPVLSSSFPQHRVGTSKNEEKPDMSSNYHLLEKGQNIVQSGLELDHVREPSSPGRIPGLPSGEDPAHRKTHPSEESSASSSKHAPHNSILSRRHERQRSGTITTHQNPAFHTPPPKRGGLIGANRHVRHSSEHCSTTTQSISFDDGDTHTRESSNVGTDPRTILIHTLDHSTSQDGRSNFAVVESVSFERDEIDHPSSKRAGSMRPSYHRISPSLDESALSALDPRLRGCDGRDRSYSPVDHQVLHRSTSHSPQFRMISGRVSGKNAAVSTMSPNDSSAFGFRRHASFGDVSKLESSGDATSKDCTSFGDRSLSASRSFHVSSKSFVNLEGDSDDNRIFPLKGSEATLSPLSGPVEWSDPPPRRSPHLQEVESSPDTNVSHLDSSQFGNPSISSVSSVCTDDRQESPLQNTDDNMNMSLTPRTDPCNSKNPARARERLLDIHRVASFPVSDDRMNPEHHGVGDDSGNMKHSTSRLPRKHIQRDSWSPSRLRTTSDRSFGRLALPDIEGNDYQWLVRGPSPGSHGAADVADQITSVNSSVGSVPSRPPKIRLSRETLDEHFSRFETSKRDRGPTSTDENADPVVSVDSFLVNISNGWDSRSIALWSEHVRSSLTGLSLWELTESLLPSVPPVMTSPPPLSSVHEDIVSTTTVPPLSVGESRSGFSVTTEEISSARNSSSLHHSSSLSNTQLNSSVVDASATSLAKGSREKRSSSIRDSRGSVQFPRTTSIQSRARASSFAGDVSSRLSPRMPISSDSSLRRTVAHSNHPSNLQPSSSLHATESAQRKSFRDRIHMKSMPSQSESVYPTSSSDVSTKMEGLHLDSPTISTLSSSPSVDRHVSNRVGSSHSSIPAPISLRQDVTDSSSPSLPSPDAEAIERRFHVVRLKS